MEQIEYMALALTTLGDAIAEYLAFERTIEEDNWDREDLEKVATQRQVYYDETTSDWNLYTGVLSSMRADLLNMNGLIKSKIKLGGGDC
jgi:hypothetical protein